ncbi:hypothetical protein PSTG_17433 [Puccinia striiformis f. sp. tritici PST-78]|uniref:Uncharacterized protein n=1 Tax=Puccinia striiformis f. sp. tritici PST-78 TaxID=1165861 RepID=A0A0L0UQ65_9BASI|nr:hypothetical protein PSTG_17433 [Puccinia striiformis f. sp. tritici PST-78]
MDKNDSQSTRTAALPPPKPAKPEPPPAHPTSQRAPASTMAILNRASSSRSSRPTPHPTGTSSRHAPPSDNELYAQILAASEEEHRRHQAELTKREREELERVRIESEVEDKVQRARMSMLEETEQAQLELVIQHSQQLSSNYATINSPQNQEEEELAFELAMALSLAQSQSSSSHHHHQTYQSSNYQPATSSAQQAGHSLLPPPSYQNSIDELSAADQASDRSLTLPQSVALPASPSPSSISISAAPPSSQPSRAHSISLSPSETQASSRPPSVYGRPLPPVPDLDHESRLSTPGPPSAIIVRPPSSAGFYDPSDSIALTHEPDPFSDQFAATDNSNQYDDLTHSSIPFPRPSTNSYLPIGEEESSVMFSSPQPLQESPSLQQDDNFTMPIPTHLHSQNISSPIEQPSNPNVIISSESFGANPNPPESVFEGVKYGLISAIDQPLSCSGQLVDTLILTHHDHHSPLNHSPIDLDQNKKEKKKNDGNHPLIAIQAWSWNRLLTYLMWHGNSRIEPGPIEVIEAEEEKTGGWQIGMSVIFKDSTGGCGVGVGEEEEIPCNVTLILELIPVNGHSQFNRSSESITNNRPINHNHRRRSSTATVITRSSTNRNRRGSTETETDIKPLTPTRRASTTTTQIIHLPKPFMNLPIKLSSLACTLHEIHTVSRMASCSSSTSSLRPRSTSSISPSNSSSKLSTSRSSLSLSNQEIYAKLNKAITYNAKFLNEEDDQGTTMNGDKLVLIRRGKDWLKRKTHQLVHGSSSDSISSSLSNGHPYPSSSSANHSLSSPNLPAHNQNVLGVDGVGLPLPTGANLVQPWESDWN